MIRINIFKKKFKFYFQTNMKADREERQRIAAVNNSH
jgi:hypothetical protein